MGRNNSCTPIQGALIGIAVVVLLLVIIFLIVATTCKDKFSNLQELFGNFELGGKVSPSGLKLTARPSLLKYASNPNVKHIVAQDLLIPIDGPNQQAIQRAEDFHKAFEAHKTQRLSSLKNIYAELGSPRTTIVMFFCKKFYILFENWALGCEKKGIPVRDKTIAFALDKDAYDKTLALGFKAFLLDSEKYEKGGGSAQYGDAGFASAMFYKNAIMYDMLEVIPTGKFLLFQDTDLIWFKDPLSYLEGKDRDIQIMHDGNNHNYKNLYANSGFIFIRNSDVTRAVLETALKNSAYIFGSGSHQKPLDRIFEHFIQHNILDLVVLPELIFVNGHLLSNTTGKLDERLKSDWMNTSYLIHYSWTLDMKDKFKKLSRLGLNFVNGK